MRPLILASGSPRRRDLLKQTGLPFTVVSTDWNEQCIPFSSPESYVRELAEAKAHVIAECFTADWIIGADTIVWIDGMILGKPKSENDARSMLKRLSGRVHQVLTGYCVCCKAEDRTISEAVTTDVEFKSLSDEEIEWYIRTGEPFDKAGSYGIQGRGVILVKRITGSYTNVVGLPICELMECLIREQVIRFHEFSTPLPPHMLETRV